MLHKAALDMAIICGTSGAWKPVRSRLIDLGCPVAHPKEIQSALDEIKSTYEEKIAQLFVDVGNEAATAEGHIRMYRESIDSRIDAKSKSIAAQVDILNERINQLHQGSGFFRRFFNRFKVMAAEQRKAKLSADLIAFIQSLHRTIADMEGRLNYLREHKTEIVEQRKQGLGSSTISSLEAVLASKELAGAQAEFEVIEQLAKLPDDHYVLNDVLLRAGHFMRFKGIPL